MPIKTIISEIKCESEGESIEGEWLITNGIGGFACGSIAGPPSRKYHSYLNAALPEPFGRTVMLNHIAQSLILPDQTEITLSTLEILGNGKPQTLPQIEFWLENGLPVWRYKYKDIVLEKRIFFVHYQNTVHISYEVLSSDVNLAIKWAPYFHFRTNNQALNVEIPNESYSVHSQDSHYEIECPNFPILRIYNSSHAPFILSSNIIENVFYGIEAERGYESVDKLKSPGYFVSPLPLKEKVTFIVSTESWNTIHILSPAHAAIIEKIRRKNLLKAAGEPVRSATIAKLVLAADQFLITPISRHGDMVRLHAVGEQVRTVIAGYPWFTDWGRDTMISLEGLTLATGRSHDAYSILHTYAYYVKNGLIPNMFPDGETKGLYHTADATLWFFHAIHRYIQVSQDDDILEFLLPILSEIIHNHVNGTLFGIKMDSDGLLIQGQEGYQLTWMDAKVGEWVVTPRRGKAVEINALWYNALKLFENWAGKPSTLSQQCYESFNKKFWFENGGYLYDIVDGEKGNDPALRPNQLFAISLDHPVLEREKWESVLNIVDKHLLTPVGLRTLAPFHPDYKSKYDGDLYARDAAYHQGTVWPWLIGPYIDALLKIYPDDTKRAQQVLKGLVEHLNKNYMNSIEEIFDAAPPYKARGCFAQAWSVAELLRCLIKVQLD